MLTNSPQSLCSSQIRPWGANFPFGRHHQTFCGASIVGAVEEGRRVFANIKKYLMYLLSANLGEIGLLLAASLAGYPLPLTAVLILT